VRVERPLGAFGVEMVGGAVPIHLLLKPPGTPVWAAAQCRTYERHWTPVNLDVLAEEIGPAVERAVAAGASLEEPISTHEWGRLALMSDPFGHGFCIVQRLGRGYDEVSG
jgi:uncharacterized glyoxalase superfamily protein PhnB